MVRDPSVYGGFVFHEGSGCIECNGTGFYGRTAVSEILGNFLGNNWAQFSRQYAYMIGFGTVFIASTLAFALVAQGFYKPQPPSAPPEPAPSASS